MYIMEGVISDGFNHMRPCCVGLIQKQDLESIKTFYEQLIKIDTDAIEDLSQYLLFPFRMILKKRNGYEVILIEISRCLTYLFKYSTLKEWNVANEILVLLCAAITIQSDKNFVARGSEELKRGICGVIGVMFEHTCYPIWQSLYKAPNVPMLGHIVTLMLSIIKSNIARDIRLLAIETLKSLSCPEYISLIDESNQNHLILATGEIFACFLPGISTSLSNILTNDTTAGHRVKCACLDLLSTAIVAVLGDVSIKLYRENEKKKEEKNVNEGKLASLLVARDQRWISNVSEKLGPVIAHASSASSSEDWSVRLSCANFCSKILVECSETLKSCANILLKVPVKLLNDDFEQVSQKCSEILEKFSSRLKQEESGSRALVEILEENLFVLCTDLPRLMRRASDGEKLSTLKIFLGYLTLLKDKVNCLLYSQPHLKKLSTALLHCLELDASSIQFLEQVVTADTEGSLIKDIQGATSWSFRKQFTHFRDKHIYNVLKSICNTLGQYGDMELLTDHFLEIYSHSDTNCKQSVLILNEILIGAMSRQQNGCSEVLRSAIKSLLAEFLSPENWYLVTSVNSDYIHTYHNNRSQKYTDSLSVVKANSTDGISYEELTQKALKSNVLLSCLHLEAILTFSKVLGEEFRNYLMDALYPLLEKTMDVNNVVSTCALHVLHGVAVGCKYRNSAELIAENSDFLISTISIQLHHMDLFPRCPAVLQAMLDNSNPDILTPVSDTIDEILTALDFQHLNPSKLLIFLPVLLSVVTAVKRWYSDNISTENETSKSRESNLGQTQDNSVENDKKYAEDLRDFLLEFQKSKKIANLEMKAEVDDNWEPNLEEQNDEDVLDEEDCKDVEEKKEVPLGVKVASKVLSRCLHLMAHSDPRVRMKVMDIIGTGIEVLQTHNDELLPMSHKLWSPLVARFGDKEFQVVMKALDTLCIMGEYSKDFLRKRFCKEILPKILAVLKAQATVSARLLARTTHAGPLVQIPGRSLERPTNSNTMAYLQSVAFKLQRKALSGLGPLLNSVQVGRADQLSVCHSCFSYLSSKQPRQLQEAAIELFKHLLQIDEDITWLFLSGVWYPTSKLEPPDEMKCHPLGQTFQTVYLGGNSDPNNEYASNIGILFEICS